MQKLARFIYFKILGWHLAGNVNMSKAEVKKAVLIGAPHTSWRDFYIGVLLRSVVGIDAKFIAKKELFKWPFGYFFKAMGGTAIDRRPGQNKVDAIAKLFDNKEEFRVALSPEGTRKKVEQWKTGFYYIAKQAHVPIIMFTLDFGKKENKISEPFFPTDDIEADFKVISEFYKDVKGRDPNKS